MAGYDGRATVGVLKHPVIALRSEVAPARVVQIPDYVTDFQRHVDDLS